MSIPLGPVRHRAMIAASCYRPIDIDRTPVVGPGRLSGERGLKSIQNTVTFTVRGGDSRLSLRERTPVNRLSQSERLQTDGPWGFWPSGEYGGATDHAGTGL
jgi:hypothetical protein